MTIPHSRSFRQMRALPSDSARSAVDRLCRLRADQRTAFLDLVLFAPRG